MSRRSHDHYHQPNPYSRANNHSKVKFTKELRRKLRNTYKDLKFLAKVILPQSQPAIPKYLKPYMKAYSPPASQSMAESTKPTFSPLAISTPTIDYPRASLLGLPAELRMLI